MNVCGTGRVRALVWRTSEVSKVEVPKVADTEGLNVTMDTTANPVTSTVLAPGAERRWLPALLGALALGILLSFADDEWPLAVGVGIVVAIAMALNRHRRMLVAVSTALVAVLLAMVGEDLAMLPLVGYACFYLGYYEPVRRALIAGPTIAVVLGIVVPVLDRERLEPLTVIGVIAMVLVPLLAGIVLQQQREQLRSQVEAATASHAEQVRLAIARDLHDVVAHGLTAVAIQSGTAIHLFDTKPEQAKEALANINEASRAALTELRAMVGELRSSEESRPTASNDPIASAIERIAPAMSVSSTGDALPATTPTTIRIAIERVVGEALANVIAHGGSGPTTVQLQVSPTSLLLTIENDQGREPLVGDSTGFGIIGMTERMAAIGGTLEARPRPDGFAVTASIPRGDW